MGVKLLVKIEEDECAVDVLDAECEELDLARQWAELIRAAIRVNQRAMESA